MTQPYSLPAQGDEHGILRFLDGLDSESASAREYAGKHWEESLRQLRGDQWRMNRPPHFMANIIRNQVERKVAALTEVKPTIKVVGTKPGISNAAFVINQAIKSIWDLNQMDSVLYRLGMTGMTLGSGFLYTYYDPSLNNFLGDIAIRHIDPRRMLIDPMVMEAEHLHQAAYMCMETFDTLGNIRQRFPGRGMLVTPDRKYSSFISEKHRSQNVGVLSSVLRSFPQIFKPGPAIKEGPIPRATMREYWLRDPQLGQDGQPLFPTGRRIIRAGDIILSDEKNPYWDGMFPIDMFDWNLDFDSPWGIGEVNELRRLQEAFNRIGDGIIRNALLSNNVKVIADMDALEPDKWDELTNEGGIIIKKRPGRELTYEMPKELPQYLFQLMSSLLSFCDMLTGNVDPSGEKTGAQAISAAALEGLQSQAQTLIRQISRRYENLLERVGQKLISRVCQYYTSDRILQLVGPSKEWLSYVYERQKIFMDDKGNVRKALDTEKMFSDFRFLVVPGSSLANTRVQRTMMAMQLRGNLGVPVPSVKTILKEADLGDPDEMMREGFEEAQQFGMGQPEPPKSAKKH